MSTTFNGYNPSSNGVDASLKVKDNSNGSVGITYFDATAARKERMKQIAAGEIAAKKNIMAQQPVAVPAIEAPVAVATHVPSNGQHVAITPQPVVEPAPTATQSRPELEKFLVNFVVEQNWLSRRNG